MPNFPTIVRRQFRQLVVAALSNSELNAVPVQSPGDWSTPAGECPLIMVRSATDQKNANGRTAPQFTTTVVVEVGLKIATLSGEETQDALELLCAVVESIVINDKSLGEISQKISYVNTNSDFSSESEWHLGMAMITFGFETFEAFDPSDIFDFPEMTQFGLHVDLVNVVDKTGSYPDAAFPASVTPLPRLFGPDGRDEGGFQISIPQE